MTLLYYVGMNGFDYISINSADTFTSGSTTNATRCVDITILDDNALEENENFILTLTTVDSSIILGTAETAIRIMDNDSQCWASSLKVIYIHY